MNNEEKVRRGQKRSFQATTWNSVLDVVKRDKLLGTHTGVTGGYTSGVNPVHTILLRNDMGTLSDAFRIIRIGEPLLTVEDDINNAMQRPAFEGLVPDSSTCPIAIMQRVPAFGLIGSGIIAGVTLAFVEMPDYTHEWANPVDTRTDRLLSDGYSGQARILYHTAVPPGYDTGLRLAVVHLGGNFGTAQIEIPVEITSTAYSTVTGYTWKLLVFDDVTDEYIPSDPTVTGSYLFEVADNRMLTAGSRVIMFPKDDVFVCQVQEEFPVTLTGTFDGINGYAWEQVKLTGGTFPTVGGGLLIGKGAFDLSGNEDMESGDKVWIRKNGDGYVIDRPVVEIPPDYIGCGLSVDGGILHVDLTDVVLNPLYWDAEECSLYLNVGCGLTNEIVGDETFLIVDHVAIAGTAVNTALVVGDDCSVAVDFEVASTTTETLVTNAVLTMVAGKLRLTQTKVTYTNYFNAAGLLIDRTAGAPVVTYTEVNPCLMTECCDAEELTAECTKSASFGDTSTVFEFTSTPSGGVPPYTYDWDWDDGTAHGTTQNPSHTYATPGVYTPFVTVTDSCGQFVFCDQSTITVSPPPPPAPYEDCETATTGFEFELDTTYSNEIAAGVTDWWYLGINAGSTVSLCIASLGLTTTGAETGCWGFVNIGDDCASLTAGGNVHNSNDPSAGYGCQCGHTWPAGEGFWIRITNYTGSPVTYSWKATTAGYPCPGL